jgi:hypothetical protein
LPAQSKTDDPADPRLPGESLEAYSRYLAYRNLGPARSVERAYALATGRRCGPVRSGAASGQWKKDCSRYRWPERAAAWDVCQLVEHGRDVVIAYVAALRQAAGRVLRALESESCRPKGWVQALGALDVLGRHISDEAVRRVGESRPRPRLGAVSGNGEGA